MALDFTLLTEEQIWGDEDGNGQLEVIKKYGIPVVATDFAFMLGACQSSRKTPVGYLTNYVWTASNLPNDGRHEGGRIRVETDCRLYWDPNMRNVATRPILGPTETKDLIPINRKADTNRIEIVEYGEYPQTVVNERTAQKLETAFKAETLQETGKAYTFDSTDLFDATEKPFIQPHQEYEYKGKKYIRFIVPTTSTTLTGYAPYLSNGEKSYSGHVRWVEVQPIEWLADPTGVWISKKALFAGVPFDTEKKYDGDFSKTFMKKYLDTYFTHEMGHDEIISRQSHDKILTGLSAQLKQATNGDAVKAIEERLRSSEKGKKVQTTPERLHEAAMIKRLKKARDILLKAHAEAQEKGDDELADSIVDLARPYSARYAAQQNKVRYRRAKRKQGGR